MGTLAAVQGGHPHGAILRALFDRAATPMLLADDGRRYRDANPAATELLGLSREEILGRCIDDFVPTTSQEALDAQWQAFLIAGEQSGRFALLRPDGESVEVEFSATAHITDGLHLSILSPRGPEDELDTPIDGAAPKRLTAREREVLTALALGETGAEIAARLVISTETVRRHVANAREKLGARTRAQAIAVALRRGEIDP